MTKSNIQKIESEVIEPTKPTSHTKRTGQVRKKTSFGKTYYFVDPSRVRAEGGPAQLRGLVKYMVDNGITSDATAMQGSEIGAKAVEEGFVKTTKLTGPVIFAYYVRRMEAEYGVEHAKTEHAKTGKIMA